MSRYDRQLIVVLAGLDRDAGLQGQALALQSKQRGDALPSEVVTIHRDAVAPSHAASADLQALAAAVAGRAAVAMPLGTGSRLYLLGHGISADRTLSGWRGTEVAGWLATLHLAPGLVISIVGDDTALDPDQPVEAQTDDAAVSFASSLHNALRAHHGVDVTVQARVGGNRVSLGAADGDGSVDAGRKTSSPAAGGDLQHHRAHSKVVFTWRGGKQQRDWAY